MDSNDLPQVAAAWVRYQVAGSEDDWWAVEQVHDLVEEDLATAWNVVNALCDAASTPETLCDIGAGPLEDTIKLYGIEALRRLDSVANEKRLKQLAVFGSVMRNSNCNSPLYSVGAT